MQSIKDLYKVLVTTRKISRWVKQQNS